MNQPKKAYGLLTAVAMIIGIVVGSGIYFKADDILTYTGGSLALGLLVLSIGPAISSLVPYPCQNLLN